MKCMGFDHPTLGVSPSKFKMQNVKIFETISMIYPIRTQKHMFTTPKHRKPYVGFPKTHTLNMCFSPSLSFFVVCVCVKKKHFLMMIYHVVLKHHNSGQILIHLHLIMQCMPGSKHKCVVFHSMVHCLRPDTSA